ncbi:hypothetical protein BSNK01_28820 [Bacillaceae bacterium]
MEAVKLSTIILTLKPELYDFLTPEELNSYIVLRNGIAALTDKDLLEIIQASIHQNKGRDVYLH